MFRPDRLLVRTDSLYRYRCFYLKYTLKFPLFTKLLPKVYQTIPGVYQKWRKFTVLVPPMQLRALWFTKSLQLDSHCLPKFRTQVPGVYLGWVFS